MLSFIITSCVAYLLFAVPTVLIPHKVGGVLSAIGIIWAECSALLAFSLMLEEGVIWCAPAVISCLIAIGFCLALNWVDKRLQEYRAEHGINIKRKNRNKFVAAFLAIVLGSFGAHKFYLGNKSLGAFYAMFFYLWIPGIIGIIEGLRYLFMNKEEFDVRYNRKPVPQLRRKEKKGVIKSRRESSVSNRLEFEDIQLDGGVARIEGNSRNALKISIFIDGQEYEFFSEGNAIVAYKTRNMARRRNYIG